MLLITSLIAGPLQELALAITAAACGINWLEESGSCSNLTPLWVFMGRLYGVMVGTVPGASSRVSTEVYRAG
jgi:hypothetical protein